MADFGINSTQLSEAQGRGTQPLQPVQEQVSHVGMSPILGEIGDIFANGMKNRAKEQAAARKNAVVGEYINNEKVYGDALTSGQWNSSQVSVASRANYMKMLAAYPEYVQEITQARSSVFGGTEVGEAQRKIEAEQKQVESDISSASKDGFVFYQGMGEEARNSQIDAWKAGVRLEDQWKKGNERVQAGYAANAEKRATGSYEMAVDQYVAKEEAVRGVIEVAAKNFDSVQSSFKDLQQQMAKGMPYEEAMAHHMGNISRVNAALLSVSRQNPEFAAPWTKLFGDMDSTIQKLLDPKSKTADERKLLEDQFAILVTKGKLAAIETNPKLRQAVVASNLFQGENMVTLINSPTVREWLLPASNPSLPKPKQIVGTPDDKDVFDGAQKAIKNLQSGKIPADKKEAATQEATSMVNNLLEQTTSADTGSLDPRALKTAGAFYASTEFGRLAIEGKVDKQTAANAQHVFQVKYDPVVKQAITGRLQQPLSAVEQESYRGAKSLMDVLSIKTVGNNVVFETKPAKSDGKLISSDAIQEIKRGDRAKEMNEAANGLNQLIRMHAHLEGTTDYAKYWEANKHILMPDVFPDPSKLKPGQVVDGYKYTGGNVRDRSNWIAEPTGK